MANITDVRVIKFSNEDIRPAADALSQLYYRSKDILARWNANGQNIIGLVTNTANDPLMDVDDGRPRITGAHIYNIIARLGEFVADYEASGSAKLNTVTAVAVNTTKK